MLEKAKNRASGTNELREKKKIIWIANLSKDSVFQSRLVKFCPCILPESLDANKSFSNLDSFSWWNILNSFYIVSNISNILSIRMFYLFWHWCKKRALSKIKVHIAEINILLLSCMILHTLIIQICRFDQWISFPMNSIYGLLILRVNENLL